MKNPIRQVTLNAGHQAVSGRFKVQVVNPRTGKVVHERPWAKNLILNNGLDGIAVRTWQASMAYCAAGMDGTPTQLDSGATTATQTTTSVTASTSFFSAGDVGSLIRWDSGELATISAYVSGTQVTVSNSASVSAGLFTLYRVDQTGLFDEEVGTVGRPIARSTGYLTGAGNCGNSIAVNVVTNRRTYEFAEQEFDRTYAELGFSHTQDEGQNCYSRVVIDGGLTVNIGFQLRVIYDQSITITPNTPTARTWEITGWINRVGSVTTNAAGTGGTPGTYDVELTGGDGTGFAATYTIGGGGSITSIDITNYGYDYTVAPGLSFPDGGISGASATANLDAWTQGDVQVCEYGVDRVGESGNVEIASATNEPSLAGNTIISEDASALPSFGTTDGRSQLTQVANENITYTTGSYTRVKRGTFGVLAAVSSSIRAISLGYTSPYSATSFTYLFDNAQAKLNTHKLIINWRHTWGRSF